MATQSVTIAVGATNGGAANFMRVGGTLQAGFTNVAIPLYTVPPNKRLVIKTRSLAQPDNSNYGRITFIKTSGTSEDEEVTYAFGAGQVISFNIVGVNFLATGMLEDDV